MNKLKALISGPDKLSEIAALETAVAENQKDIATLLNWTRPLEQNPELQAMLAEFRSDISNRELGNKIIAFHVSLSTEAEARHMLHRAAYPVVITRNNERLRSTLKPALAALAAKLKIELAETRKREKTHAQEYGTDAESSPVIQKIEAAIHSVESTLPRVDEADENTLPALVRFALEGLQ